MRKATSAPNNDDVCSLYLCHQFKFSSSRLAVASIQILLYVLCCSFLSCRSSEKLVFQLAELFKCSYQQHHHTTTAKKLYNNNNIIIILLAYYYYYYYYFYPHNNHHIIYHLLMIIIIIIIINK